MANKYKKFIEFINLNNCSQLNKIITKHINIPPYKTRRVRVHNFDFSTVDLDPTNSSDFHTKKVKTSFFFFDLKCYSSNIGNAELQALQMATRWGVTLGTNFRTCCLSSKFVFEGRGG